MKRRLWALTDFVDLVANAVDEWRLENSVIHLHGDLLAFGEVIAQETLDGLLADDVFDMAGDDQPGEGADGVGVGAFRVGDGDAEVGFLILRGVHGGAQGHELGFLELAGGIFDGSGAEFVTFGVVEFNVADGVGRLFHEVSQRLASGGAFADGPFDLSALADVFLPGWIGFRQEFGEGVGGAAGV